MPEALVLEVGIGALQREVAALEALAPVERDLGGRRDGGGGQQGGDQYSHHSFLRTNGWMRQRFRPSDPAKGSGKGQGAALFVVSWRLAVAILLGEQSHVAQDIQRMKRLAGIQVADHASPIEEENRGRGRGSVRSESGQDRCEP